MEIKIRPARQDDTFRIWEIRNEPESRVVAETPKTIPLKDHIAWFGLKYFSHEDNFCFVAESDGQVVGYCRYDSEEEHYLISIAIDSSVHGKGLGTSLLSKSVKLFKSAKPLHATVRKNNLASIRMFEKCAFKRISEDEKNFYYQLKKTHS